MRFVVLVLMACLPLTVLAQGQRRSDGDWWRSLTATAKTYYVAGFVKAQADAMFGIPALLCIHEGKVGEASMACIDERVKVLKKEYVGFAGMSVGQVEDGIEAFYRDYRNRRINFQGATVVVAMSAGGAPASEVDAHTERLRRFAVDPE